MNMNYTSAKGLAQVVNLAKNPCRVNHCECVTLKRVDLPREIVTNPRAISALVDALALLLKLSPSRLATAQSLNQHLVRAVPLASEL